MIRITISGPQGSGKTMLGQRIEKLINQMKLGPVSRHTEGYPRTPLEVLKGTKVVIVEVQDEDTDA